MKTTLKTAPAGAGAIAVAIASGLLFGLGLLASGMTDPSKVKAFVDLAGAWDPSLAFVMGGAIVLASLGFALAARRVSAGKAAWSGEPIVLPETRRIDARLIAGGLLFGAGWGLAGYCPGPALVVAAGFGPGAGSALGFVAAMAVGMLLGDVLHDALAARRNPARPAAGAARRTVPAASSTPPASPASP